MFFQGKPKARLRTQHMTNRRTFIKTTATATAATALGPLIVWGRHNSPNEKIVVAAMGTNSRGAEVIRNFAAQPGVEVAAICDVDERAIAKGVEFVRQSQAKASPKGEKDIRKVLENKDLDALMIAAPDHWHAPATIMACAAGKHVYVEKPCGHNPREGEMCVEAAAKHQRVVQMGNQRRSWNVLQEGIAALHQGAIGKVYFARAWYANGRKGIGHGKPAPVPAWLDYDLWQGPAPRLPFRDNLVHYNWHWFWHWGTGEACNNGTHEIDIARWGLQADYPTRVTSAGGRFAFADDWETPDTQSATFEFEGGKMILWESRSCAPQPLEGIGRGVQFFGETGSLIVRDNNYTLLDHSNKVVKDVKDTAAQTNSIDRTGPGQRLDGMHIQNFLAAIRDPATKLNAHIAEGHKSVLLCHLANIAYRTGSTLNCNPRNGHVLNHDEAMALWQRSYEKGWEPVA
jgi:predicted dehydrogenase